MEELGLDSTYLTVYGFTAYFRFSQDAIARDALAPPP
jgi:hypothetical protein